MPLISKLIGAIALASYFVSADAAPHTLGKRDWFADYPPGAATDVTNCIVSLLSLSSFDINSSLSLLPQNPSHMALTFDDGTSSFTDSMISALQSASAPATFFFIGQNVGWNPGAAKRAYDAGFQVPLLFPPN
jgi:peptidoglycan/xylan/chitin deacetylase (PgdA/CDA1 family)